ncbi:MAG: ABC transporter permease [Gemmatimonadota bacterium]
MNGWLNDLRYAVRGLLKTPGFTVVAVLSLALGIGANATIFSVVSGLLLKPLPVAQPNRFVGLYTSDYSGPPFGTSSYPDFLEFRDRSRSFSAMAAALTGPFSLSADGPPELIGGQLVSAGYLGLLDRPLALGRGFSAQEDEASSAQPVVVVSHSLWQRRFGSDRAILGKTIRVSGQPVTVVGVGPADFRGINRGIAIDLWLPISMARTLVPHAGLDERGARGLSVFAELKPGVSAAAAQAELAVVAEQLHREYQEQWTDVRQAGRRITLVPESGIRFFPDAQGAAFGASALFLTVVGLVLAIACGNLANLLLARAQNRRKELGIRAALGASRWRLARTQLVESCSLSVAGGTLGAVLAVGAVRLISAFHPPIQVPIQLEFTIDYRVLIFTALIAMVTGLALGLAPALQSAAGSLVTAFKDDSAGLQLRGGRSRLRGALVVAQVAFSTLLLIAAGLFLRSLGRSTATDPGFSTRQGADLSVDLSINRYDEARGKQLLTQALERARATPGVTAAALTTALPLSPFGNRRRGMAIKDYVRQPGDDLEFRYVVVSAGYFATMGIPLRRGRAFEPTDREGAAGVVIVNEAFVRRFWPAGEALGRAVSLTGPNGPFLDVIGVVPDVKLQSVGEDVVPALYAPLDQQYESAVTLMVASARPAVELIPALRNIMAEADPDLPLFGVETLEEHFGFALFPARVAGSVLGGFGFLGLLLASMGIYGVVAYAVSRRKREIGIRMALGAKLGTVLAGVMRDGLVPVAIGLGLGLGGSLAVSRLLAGFLNGVSPLDLPTYAAVGVGLAAVAAAACYIPARRAARVNPIDALRAE